MASRTYNSDRIRLDAGEVEDIHEALVAYVKAATFPVHKARYGGAVRARDRFAALVKARECGPYLQEKNPAVDQHDFGTIG